MADGNKPHVLILGGIGFIGRNLTEFLIKNDLVSTVRVVDKVPPQTAWLNKTQQEIFNDPRVEFKSANLINPSSCQNAFNIAHGEFDYVINLASETKYGQTDPVYREGIYKLSINCAKEASRRNVKRYIEISSGHISSGDKVPMTENDKPNPWTFVARYKIMVEEELQAMQDLDWVILRPAIVYGIGDKQGVTPRLIIGAVYRHLGEMMKLLWNKDMKMNTVHVSDLCRAIWHACRICKKGEIYNVVDKGDSTQGKISDVVSEIFNVNHDYVGNMMSNIARVDMASLVDDINEKHLTPWAESCKRDNIINTPLTPYLDQELLYHKHLYLNGTKLENTNFTYLVPEINKENLLEIVQDFVRMGIFPNSLMA